jgi:hypothetical protein
LLRVHTPDHLHRLQLFCSGAVPPAAIPSDTYINAHTLECAALAAGSAAEVALRVWRGESDRGAAIIRPPGHHAESNTGCAGAARARARARARVRVRLCVAVCACVCGFVLPRAHHAAVRAVCLLTAPLPRLPPPPACSHGLLLLQQRGGRGARGAGRWR